MNPTSPVSFSCDETRLLDRIVHDADAHAAKAQKCLTDRDGAHANVTKTCTVFLTSIDHADAVDFVNATTEAAKFTAVAEAIECVGGPTALREKFFQTNDVYSVLSQGFARRVEALDARLAVARKVLANLRAEKTEAGVAYIEGDPAVIAAHATVINLGVQKNAADAEQQYCYRWTPSVAHRPFSEIYGSLVAPLV